LKDRPDQAALIFVSTETDQEKVYSFRELHAEVQRMAAVLKELGVQKGDRVLIYMPMVAEAAFAMLACTRIGAIHSVVFGGFASGSLASRIEDAEPRVIVSADAGSRGGKAVPYKPFWTRRFACPSTSLSSPAGRSWHGCYGNGCRTRPSVGRFAEKNLDTVVECEWVDATHPSYTLYTSGTTGKPKGVQRDTGGYCVALAASMKHIYAGNAGETYFLPATSAGSWVTVTSFMAH
jgi:propionyl-CoA synthetase